MEINLKDEVMFEDKKLPRGKMIVTFIEKNKVHCIISSTMQSLIVDKSLLTHHKQGKVSVFMV